MPSEDIDQLRLKYGFWIIITGFALVAFITEISTFRWTEVTSVATVVGVVASLVGTVVGAFFGVQVGSAGKERAEAARERSDEMAKAALSMLPPESAAQLRAEMDR
jgi:amino acid transporter